MIRKITSNEYLKRFDNMTTVEKSVYLNRVGEWFDKQAPLIMRRRVDDASVFMDAMQCSVMWNDAECQAWEEGVRLLTALVASGDTWLPDMLYTKSAKRAIKNMVKQLKVIQQETNQQATIPVMEGSGRTEDTKVSAPSHTEEGRGEVLGKESLPIARPNHFDQYVHLLPQKTQEHAAMYGPLMRELEVAREKMNLLVDDPNASAKSLEQWAKTATSLDSKIGSIKKELDAEWEKLVKSRKVVLDDFGNARIVENPQEQDTQEQDTQEQDTQEQNPQEQKPQGQDAQRQDVQEQATQEQTPETVDDNKTKAAAIRKWLIDKRNAKTDTQKEKWIAKYKEMLEIGGKAAMTDKVLEAAEYYGVDLTKI